MERFFHLKKIVILETHLNLSKKIKINFKDISIKSINDYDEIILIGSGKGVTSVSKLKELKWKRKKSNCYNKLNKIYNSLV